MEQTKQHNVRLYLVEEDDIYLDLCRAILQSKVPVELLGFQSSRDIYTLSQAVLKLSPDVMLIRINKPEVDFIKELEQIRIDNPKIGIVLSLGHISARDIDLLRRLALKGTSGTAFFLKKPLERIEELLVAIPEVSQGKFILDVPLASFMFGGKSEHPFLKRLTPRELEILNLLAEGYTNLAIATTLNINLKTVERHLNSMYGKLNINGEFGDRHLRVTAAKLCLEAKVG